MTPQVHAWMDGHTHTPTPKWLLFQPSASDSWALRTHLQLLSLTTLFICSICCCLSGCSSSSTLFLCHLPLPSHLFLHLPFLPSFHPRLLGSSELLSPFFSAALYTKFYMWPVAAYRLTVKELMTVTSTLTCISPE